MDKKSLGSKKPMLLQRGKNAILHLSPHYLIIAAVALLAHGFILFMDGVTTDGWILYSLLQHRDWDITQAWFLQASMPLSLVLHWSMSYLPNFLLWYRVLIVSVIIATGIMVYAIGVQSHLLGQRESLWIALLSVTFPAYHVAFVLVRVASALYLLLFLIALWLALRMLDSQGARHWLLRGISLLLFLVSFTVNSLLVFYAGALLLLFLVYKARYRSELSWYRAALSTLRSYPDFLVPPLLYWVGRPLLFPRHGVYESYNQIELPPGAWQEWVQYTLVFLRTLSQPFQDLLGLFSTQLGITVISIVVALLIYQRLGAATVRGIDTSRAYRLFGFGCVLLILAIFPYVMVDKAPYGGFHNRHSFLLALPMAIIIFALLRLLFTDTRDHLSRSGFVLLVLCCVGFSLSLNSNYIIWQSRWIINASIMANLERIDEARNFSVYIYDDPGIDMQPHRLIFSEWSATFREVWGEQTRIAVHTSEAYETLVRERGYLFTGQRILADFDPAGCQARLRITPGSFTYTYDRIFAGNQHAEVVARYLYWSWFGGQERREELLLNLTHVWIEAQDAPAATNCTRSRAEQLQQTVAIYDQILAYRPTWAEAYQRRGQASFELRAYDAALGDFRQALELDPESALRAHYIGRVHLAQDAPAQAMAAFDQAIAIDPELAVAYHHRGRANVQQGYLDWAIRDFSTTLQLRPENALAYYDRGVIYAERGDIHQALDDFNRAIQFAPTSDRAHLQRGIMYWESEDYVRALQDLDSAADLGSTSSELYYYRGLTHFALKNYDQARADLQRVNEQQIAGTYYADTVKHLQEIAEYTAEEYIR